MDMVLEELRRRLIAYTDLGVLGAMAELDVATKLLERGNSASARDLALDCQSDGRGMEVLLDALVALGFFSKSMEAGAGLYSVKECYGELFDSRTPGTWVPAIRHWACTMRSWSQLGFCVKEGRPHGCEPSVLGAKEDRVSFLMAMNSVALSILEQVMESLERTGFFARIEACGDPVFLDVGCASGTYSEAFLKRMPRSRALLFDLPSGIELARKRFEPSPLASRVEYAEGDFLADPLPGPADFVWLSAIIHQLGREECRMLYAKAHAAMKPGASIAIRDFVMDSGRTSPRLGALFGVNMLVHTPNGGVYTFDEIKEDLEAAGFEGVEHLVDVPSMAAVVAARKPR